MARTVQDVQGVNSVIQNVAELQFIAGDRESAIATAREGIAAARDAEDREAQCRISANLGAYLLQQHEVEEGGGIVTFALREAIELELEFIALYILQHAALLAALRGEHELAGRLQGHVDAAYAADGASREPTEQASCDLVLEALATHLSDLDRERLLAEGQALDRAAAVESALSHASA
jgi:hypothetical protein